MHQQKGIGLHNRIFIFWGLSTSSSNSSAGSRYYTVLWIWHKYTWVWNLNPTLNTVLLWIKAPAKCKSVLNSNSSSFFTAFCSDNTDCLHWLRMGIYTSKVCLKGQEKTRIVNTEYSFTRISFKWAMGWDEKLHWRGRETDSYLWKDNKRSILWRHDCETVRQNYPQKHTQPLRGHKNWAQKKKKKRSSVKIEKRILKQMELKKMSRLQIGWGLQEKLWPFSSHRPLGACL